MLILIVTSFLLLSYYTTLFAGLLDGTCWRGDIYVEDQYAFTRHLGFYEDFIYAAVSRPDLYLNITYNRYALPYHAAQNSDGTIDYFCISFSRLYYGFYWGICDIKGEKCSYNAYGISLFIPVELNPEEYELVSTDWNPRKNFIPH